mgnify:CR=1 FL=1
MKEFNLRDDLRVSDSKIRGFVVLENENGVVFAKPNMIVESGRQYIRDLVYGNVFTAETKAFTKLEFGCLPRFRIFSAILETNSSPFKLSAEPSNMLTMAK